MLTQTESHAQRQFLSISLPFCQCLYSELEGLLTAAWVKQEPQDNIKQVLRGSRARVHARHAFKRHCSERMWFREACVWQVEGQHQHVGQGSPTAALKCVWSRHSSRSPFQTLLPPAAPQGFGLVSPWTVPRSTCCRRCQDRCLPPAQHHLSGFVLPLECPLNLLSHMPSSSHVHSPLQNKRFEMKVQSCSNNHINYLFRWGKRWVKSSFADMEELLVSTAKIIFPAGLVFHKVIWPKGVCTHNQVWLKTKQQHSICHCLVHRTWREERWKQTRDADKNFFLCYSNKKYIHTEI